MSLDVEGMLTLNRSQRSIVQSRSRPGSGQKTASYGLLEIALAPIQGGLKRPVLALPAMHGLTGYTRRFGSFQNGTSG